MIEISTKDGCFIYAKTDDGQELTLYDGMDFSANRTDRSKHILLKDGPVFFVYDMLMEKYKKRLEEGAEERDAVAKLIMECGIATALEKCSKPVFCAGIDLSVEVWDSVEEYCAWYNLLHRTAVLKAEDYVLYRERGFDILVAYSKHGGEEKLVRALYELLAQDGRALVYSGDNPLFRHFMDIYIPTAREIRLDGNASFYTVERDDINGRLLETKGSKDLCEELRRELDYVVEHDPEPEKLRELGAKIRFATDIAIREHEADIKQELIDMRERLFFFGKNIAHADVM